MASSTTVRVGQTRALAVTRLVGGRPGAARPVYASSDTSKVAIDAEFDDRVVVRGVAPGTSTVTASVGAASDSCVVTVIAAGAVESVSLTPGF